MTTALVFAAIWWGTFPAAAALVALLTWSKPYALNGALVLFRASPLLRWLTAAIIRMNPSAFTWCFALFSWADIDPKTLEGRRLIVHEGDHAFWALVLGLAYPLICYPGGALIAVAKGGHWYRDNYWERRAYAKEKAVV